MGVIQMTTIADRLKALRAQKGVNQDTVAEACNISRIALARYETGARVPRAENAARIADYYGVSVDYLLGREEQPTQTAESKPAPKEMATADMRAEAKQILEGMTDEQYQAALQYLKFLKAQK
jgi:transcriptional regulator with XRE-family HTH domain